MVIFKRFFSNKPSPNAPAGFINLFKPAGQTSHDCIDACRKILRTRKIGHAGTLDPQATGVLPLAVGKATKLIQYLPTQKEYSAEIQFGITTHTDDQEGKVLTRNDASWLTKDVVSESLTSFVGDLMQRPPNISALKIKGRRLYDLTRSGEIDTVEVKKRPVRVDSIQLIDFKSESPPVARVLVACGPGTYIRSIARDLGEVLVNPATSEAVGANLLSIERRQSAMFHIGTSISLDELKSQVQKKTFKLISSDEPFSHLPALQLPESLLTLLETLDETGQIEIEAHEIILSSSSDNDSKALAEGQLIRFYNLVDNSFCGLVIVQNVMRNGTLQVSLKHRFSTEASSTRKYFAKNE